MHFCALASLQILCQFTYLIKYAVWLFAYYLHMQFGMCHFVYLIKYRMQLATLRIYGNLIHNLAFAILRI